MANDDLISSYGGLRPYEQPYGQVRVHAYKLTTSATVGISLYDAVTLDANGRAAAYSSADLALILGPIVGFQDTKKASLPSSITDLSKAPTLPANTDAYVLVADDPDQLFAIQTNTQATLDETDIGTTATIAFRTVRSDGTTGISTLELDLAGAGGDTGGNIQVVGLLDNVNNDGTENAFGANYAKAVVRIYHHSLSGKQQPGGI